VRRCSHRGAAAAGTFVFLRCSTGLDGWPCLRVTVQTTTVGAVRRGRRTCPVC